jgi:hypothetical protein
MVFVFFSILKCKTTRKDSRGSGGTGPVVDRVNVYRTELDNNSTTTGSGQFGQRSQYHTDPNAKAPSIDFQYQDVNRRGKTVTRNTLITF